MAAEAPLSSTHLRARKAARIVSLRQGFVAITCCSAAFGTKRTSPGSTTQADRYTR
jgi:hypothetical protein